MEDIEQSVHPDKSFVTAFAVRKTRANRFADGFAG